MTETTTLNDDWIDILPDAIEADGRTRPGDLFILEMRIVDGRPVPGASVRVAAIEGTLSRRRGRVTRKVNLVTWDRIEGEILLTDDDRRRFLLGEVPRLTWPAPFDCPVTLQISEDFEVTIDGLERLRKPGFAPRWTPERVTIRDMRPELMLRAGMLPNTRYRKGHDDAIHGPTSLEIELAAIESAYTRDRSRSADREVSVILLNEVGAVSRAEALRAEQRTSIRRDPYRSTRKAA